MTRLSIKNDSGQRSCVRAPVIELGRLIDLSPLAFIREVVQHSPAARRPLCDRHSLL